MFDIFVSYVRQNEKKAVWLKISEKCVFKIRVLYVFSIYVFLSNLSQIFFNY